MRLYRLINDDTLLRDVFTLSSSSSFTIFTMVLFEAYNEIIRFLVIRVGAAIEPLNQHFLGALILVN